MNCLTCICGTASAQPALVMSMSATVATGLRVSYGKHLATAVRAQDRQAREGLRRWLPCLEHLKRLAWCQQRQVAAAI
jgi:hypothetical protein